MHCFTTSYFWYLAVVPMSSVLMTDAVDILIGSPKDEQILIVVCFLGRENISARLLASFWPGGLSSNTKYIRRNRRRIQSSGKAELCRYYIDACQCDPITHDPPLCDWSQVSQQLSSTSRRDAGSSGCAVISVDKLIFCGSLFFRSKEKIVVSLIPVPASSLLG